MKVVKKEEQELPKAKHKYVGRKLTILVILLIGFIYLGTIDYHKDTDDSAKFSNLI